MLPNFDFTGYVPIAGSSEQGFLSINHERHPVGGVTILDVQFNPTIQSWSYSASEAVDFSVVGGARRNCSGTVTDWGTIVSSEESESGDINGDGYNDFGWNVEIDPVTKQVIDQPGGLVGGDKLWEMGNFKHENVVIHSNQRTVYQAEDKSPGNLYKFVADVAGNLSSGDLYVYVGPKSGNGQWVQINNKTQTEQNTTIAQAQAVNATVFAGGEDVEISPIDGKVYVAVKGESKVYRFNDDNPLSGGTVSNFETYVGDMSYTLETASGVVSVPWANGNDNLAFDAQGNLWVLQDGANNHIWVVDAGHTQSNPQVRIFGHSPAGSEPTGITFSPDFRFLFMSFQHPSSSNNVSAVKDAFQQDAYFDKDVAIVIARKEFLGNCHPQLTIDDTPPVFNYQASSEIESTAILSPNANVEFRAGDCITLYPGISVTQPSQFLAKIEDCIVVTP